MKAKVIYLNNIITRHLISATKACMVLTCDNTLVTFYVQFNGSFICLWEFYNLEVQPCL